MVLAEFFQHGKSQIGRAGEALGNVVQHVFLHFRIVAMQRQLDVVFHDTHQCPGAIADLPT